MSGRGENGLDYELKYSALTRYWNVWTPAYDGATGAIIGSGKTRAAAKRDAVKSMAWLIQQFEQKNTKGTKIWKMKQR